MIATRSQPLPAAAVLPATAPLRLAAERVGRAQLPVLSVDGGAVTEAAVRAAWQDRRDPELPIGELARRDDVVDTQAQAQARFAAEPRCAAVVVGGTQLMLRLTEPVTTAVVMAGGIGTRLRPLTEDTPKPLLEVGGISLLERIVQLLVAHGVQHVYVSVNYLREKIKAHVGDGSPWGVRVDYLEEDEPLDTGAALALMPRPSPAFFVINGDVLTNANLTAMARQHALSGAIATVATHLHPMPLPYGFVHHDGDVLRQIEEKPVLRYAINAGIYVIAPAALEHAVPGAPLAMVPFLNERIAAGQPVCRFPLVEYWNDVGLPQDYMRAQKEVRGL